MPDTLPFDTTDDRLARAAWSRLAEPRDAEAGALVRALGASAALDWLIATARAWSDPPVLAAGAHWHAAAQRWIPRLSTLDPLRELEVRARARPPTGSPAPPGPGSPNPATRRPARWSRHSAPVPRWTGSSPLPAPGPTRRCSPPERTGTPPRSAGSRGCPPWTRFVSWRCSPGVADASSLLPTRSGQRRWPTWAPTPHHACGCSATRRPCSPRPWPWSAPAPAAPTARSSLA